jgi:zinc finger protein 830
VVCGILIKHASAWEGHLGSKLHRTNTTLSKGKKTADTREKTEEQSLPGKRKAETNESDKETNKKRRMYGTTGGRPMHLHELPNDFFSDPSHVPVIPKSSDESDDDANAINPAETTAPSTSVLDLEYGLFQRGFIEEGTERSQTYDQATIVVEPVPASPIIPGFPTSMAVLAQNEREIATRDSEERELIMDRLLEEERAQEDADMRVHLMKNKFEGLKKRREARKALKLQVHSTDKLSVKFNT